MRSPALRILLALYIILALFSMPGHAAAESGLIEETPLLEVITQEGLDALIAKLMAEDPDLVIETFLGPSIVPEDVTEISLANTMIIGGLTLSGPAAAIVEGTVIFAALPPAPALTAETIEMLTIQAAPDEENRVIVYGFVEEPYELLLKMAEAGVSLIIEPLEKGTHVEGQWEILGDGHCAGCNRDVLQNPSRNHGRLACLLHFACETGGSSPQHTQMCPAGTHFVCQGCSDMPPTQPPRMTTTPRPTVTPTPTPTLTPTRTPTTWAPTWTPTPAPTSVPTQTPPTPAPTSVPTQIPTAAPTQTPTPAPTSVPTQTPTPAPTSVPTPTLTPEPTQVPTPTPTPEPTQEPTTAPTQEPTQEPTTAPTQEPTQEPTTAPTPEPTQEPTPAPTPESTPEPTQAPTPEPTPEPTQAPTPESTQEPTPTPTPVPSAQILASILCQQCKEPVQSIDAHLCAPCKAVGINAFACSPLHIHCPDCGEKVPDKNHHVCPFISCPDRLFCNNNFHTHCEDCKAIVGDPTNHVCIDLKQPLLCGGCDAPVETVNAHFCMLANGSRCQMMFTCNPHTHCGKCGAYWNGASEGHGCWFPGCEIYHCQQPHTHNDPGEGE